MQPMVSQEQVLVPLRAIAQSLVYVTLVESVVCALGMEQMVHQETAMGIRKEIVQ